MERVAVAAQSIAAGNFGERLPVAGRDELTELSRSFNQMAEEIQRQMASLQESARQKQQLIDNLSHEMRTPLTTIYGYAEYIQKALIPEEERYECTRFIMSECVRLQNMAYQLLDMALLRTDGPEPGSCFLAALFGQSEKSMQMRAAEKRIKLTYAAPGDFMIRGNEEQLLILMNNLIDNAIKASPPEEEIRIRAYPEKDRIVVEVEDHGTGMEPEQVPHIKEAFYRVDKARSRAAGGAGLGLAICDRIARIHHADMTFLSEPGKGTTVKLFFPGLTENLQV